MVTPESERHKGKCAIQKLEWKGPTVWLIPMKSSCLLNIRKLYDCVNMLLEPMDGVNYVREGPET